MKFKMNAKAIIKVVAAVGSAAAAGILAIQAKKALGESALRAAPEDIDTIDATATEETTEEQKTEETPDEEEEKDEEG